MYFEGQTKIQQIVNDGFQGVYIFKEESLLDNEGEFLPGAVGCCRILKDRKRHKLALVSVREKVGFTEPDLKFARFVIRRLDLSLHLVVEQYSTLAIVISRANFAFINLSNYGLKNEEHSFLLFLKWWFIKPKKLRFISDCSEDEALAKLAGISFARGSTIRQEWEASIRKAIS